MRITVGARLLAFVTVVLLLLAACRNEQAAPGAAPAPAAPGHNPQAIPTQPAVPSTLNKVAFYSDALGRRMRMQVYLPPGYDGSHTYPVLYMLHGYFGNESAWMPEMQLEKTADRLIEAGRIDPVIIVSPEMDNSYGLNSSDRYRLASPGDPTHSRYYGRYEDYFVEDVLTYVDTHYRTEPSKQGRYVGGFSMGGFASLEIAFRHPELFSKAGGHSPALWLDESDAGSMISWLYPTQALRRERDPIELARTSDLHGMSVYLDCGSADDYKLYRGTSKLYDNLQARGVPSEYHLNPGGHNRTYWQSREEDYLFFYAGRQ